MDSNSSPQILDQVQNVFRGVFEDATLEINRETNAEQIDAWDSLKHISLIVALERQFKIRLALGEIEKLKNVGDLLEVIERRLDS